MEFEIKSFLELNLIVDGILLLVFSFTVLLRNPKFLLFLVALNLCQYVVWVPDREILEAHKKLQEQQRDKDPGNREAPAPDNSRGFQEGLLEGMASGNPVQVSEQTARIYDQVLQGMGAGEGAAGAAMEVSLNAWRKKLADSEKESGKGLSFSPISMIMQAGQGDMHAAWFLTRLFWLAATFYLYIQRPQIGSTVFAFNLLPIPFLAQFVPYLWFRFNELQWVKDLNAWSETGSLPKETLEFLVFHGISFLLLALPLFAIMLAAGSQWRKSRESGLQDYLNPSRFDLMINGTRIPFEVKGSEVLAGDFRLSMKKLSYDPENPQVWYLKTGTKVEFVEK